MSFFNHFFSKTILLILVLFGGMGLSMSFTNSSAQESAEGWIYCADEGESCATPGGTVPTRTVVRFGNSDGYSYVVNTGFSVACLADSFDPLPSTAAKTCEYWGGTNYPDYAGTPYFPTQSSQISCQDETHQNNLWVVNPDNHSVSVIDTFLEPGSQHVRLLSQQELYLNFRTPTSAARIGELVAITFRDDDKVVFYDGATATPRFTIDTGHGSQPVAALSNTAESRLFVSLFGSGELVTINLASRSISDRLTVGPMPRAMAMHGNRLLVTRFISEATHGELYDIDVSGAPTLVRTIEINKVRVNDGLSHGSGVPNFLSSIVINPDGTEAYVTAVKANIDRGTSSASNGNPLDDDNTVRPMVAIIDLVANQDTNVIPISPDGTVDFDNAADPAGITYLADGQTQMITFQGNNVALARDTHLNTSTQFSTGFAPQEMCATLRTLYVKNFTGRTVSAIDVAEYLENGQRNPRRLTINTVENELLTAEELEGLQQFYISSIPEMGAEGYISCASCHKDGGQDGQVWDMTSFGEGLRNTISLNGTSGTRFGDLHWSQNFDEVQDFELQIETLNKGDGLIPGQTFTGQSPLDLVTAGQSAELDALAAYVASLGKQSVKRSPYRTYTGDLSEAAERGEQLFATLNCASCHTGQAFRDGQSHDVGTILATSGSRLSGALNAIRTPTLIELWETAPYFHNGSAKTLADVFDTGIHQLTLTSQQEANLIEFLFSIDQEMFIEDDVPFPEN